MRDLYRRNGLTPYESDPATLEEQLSGATEEVEAGRQILLHAHRKAHYDRYHQDLTLLARLREELHLADAPFCRLDELGDFYVRPAAASAGGDDDGPPRAPGRPGHDGRGPGDRRWRRWGSRAALLCILAFVMAFQLGWEVPWVTENEKSGGEPGGAQKMAPAGPENEARRFVVAEMANVYNKPEPGAVPVDQLMCFDVVHVEPRGGGWARLLNRGIKGYVETRHLASEADCRARGLSRPENGAVLESGATGGHVLTVRNNASRDAIVKMTNQLGGSVVRLYVHSQSAATYRRLPAGEFLFKFATGESFSPYCGAFLTEMVATAADSRVRVPSPETGELNYTIQGAAHGNFSTTRIVLDAF